MIRYLLADPLFPRAVRHCLVELETSMLRLPNNEGPLRRMPGLQRMLDEQTPDTVEEGSLHRLMDELQIELGGVHEQICAAWFLPEQAA